MCCYTSAFSAHRRVQSAKMRMALRCWLRGAATFARSVTPWWGRAAMPYPSFLFTNKTQQAVVILNIVAYAAERQRRRPLMFDFSGSEGWDPDPDPEPVPATMHQSPLALRIAVAFCTCPLTCAVMLTMTAACTSRVVADALH